MLALQTSSEEQHLSPITRLHDELLWMIMLENTELHNEGRLTTTRYTSQVCRKWRQVMLDSPSMWGRLIDILELQVTSSSWIQEVLVRSRNAALWITGPMHAFEPSPMKPDIFSTLVSAEWARIEILDVSDFWDSGENLTVDGHEQAQYWRRLFNQPAPLLKEFTFRYTTQSRRSARAYGVPQGWLLPSPLFNAIAPALRKFDVNRTENFQKALPKFTMDMSLSWLSKLRSFTLRQDLELDPLLGLLRGMPLLENLDITRFSASAVGLIHQESPASLPKLSSLRLEDWEPTDTVTFLESISTSPRCCLSMSNQPRDMFASHQQDSTRAHGVFMRYMQDYFEHHRVTNLSLSYNHSYLEIRENTVISKGHPFNFSVWIPSSPYNSSFLRLLLTSPFFACVRQLDLSNSERSIPYAPSAFSSVETLDLRLTGLESLLKCLEGHDLLVRLRTLILHGRELRSEYGRWLHGVLEKRRQIARPISVLDLRNIDGISCNLDALDDLVGIWILFPYSSSRSEESYVCGTGRPELLRFADPKHYTLYQPSYISRRLPGDKTTRTYGWSGQT